MVGANDETVRLDLDELPGRLDHVDALIAEGVIGADEPNAADFQIATTVRVMLSFADLRPLIDGRPAAARALRLVPRWPDEVPPFLPREWL
jgi:glutathione S-transferase